MTLIDARCYPLHLLETIDREPILGIFDRPLKANRDFDRLLVVYASNGDVKTKFCDSRGRVPSLFGTPRQFLFAKPKKPKKTFYFKTHSQLLTEGYTLTPTPNNANSLAISKDKFTCELKAHLLGCKVHSHCPISLEILARICSDRLETESCLEAINIQEIYYAA